MARTRRRPAPDPANSPGCAARFAREAFVAFAMPLASCGTPPVVVPTDTADVEIRPPLQPPIIPIGTDAYRDWVRWPVLRVGVRASMRSTYDRAGGNEAADASHFIRQERDDFNVTLDSVGPGVLYFARTNHWHGSPWHYVVDGDDMLVQESSTATPDMPVANSTFLPADLFPNPLTWTWSITRGADLNWVPMAFERSFVLAYGRTHYGTGYYILHRFAEGADNLSRPLTRWTRTPPAAEALDVLRLPGTDIVPLGAAPSSESGTLELPAGAETPVTAARAASQLVRLLRFSVPRGAAATLARARLRIYWDDRPAPSVDAPLGLFFGTGSVFNRDNLEWLVRALPATVRFSSDRVEFSMYFPMPFHRAVRITLAEAAAPVADVRWDLRREPLRESARHVGYFHATYRDHGIPMRGHDLVFLDTRSVEGSGDWCGHFVGTSFIFTDRADLGTLEGDPRFYFDDSDSAQAQGTGTEEWGGGGDYWGGRSMTLPLAGHPVGVPDARLSRDPEDLIHSAYRFLLADLMPFGRNARITFEHGGQNDSVEHYRSVTYWYGTPSACLALTDTLDVGDPASETQHRYSAPGSSGVESVTSRFEWGVDTLDGRELYPATTETGRVHRGRTEFRVAIDPANVGVMLRRTLDLSHPDQRADVYVADDRDDAPFVRAGTWFTAGSNACVYSNPPAELGAAGHLVQTSNRRWRQEEFLIARRLTEGRSALRVRVEFVPVDRAIVPGGEVLQSAWSEFRYDVYSYVMPSAP